jgi:hypothetical protein
MLENQNESIEADEVPNGDEQLALDLGEGNNGAEIEIGDDGNAQLKEVESKEEAAPTKAADDTKDHEEYSTKVRKRIEKMTAKLREAERREQAALEYARQVQANLQQAQTRVQSLDQGYLNEYKGRVDSQLSIVEANLQDAVERGDGKAVVEAQKMLSQLILQQEKINQAEAQRQRQAPVQQAQQPYQPPAAPQAPRVDTKAEEWAEQNEWFGSDKVMTHAAFGVHAQLEEEGFDLSSQEYYDELDRRIRKEFPHKFKRQQVDTTSSTAPGIAPATRGTTVSPNGRRTIKLTPSEVAIARKIGVPLEEYAKYVRR